MDQRSGVGCAPSFDALEFLFVNKSVTADGSLLSPMGRGKWNTFCT